MPKKHLNNGPVVIGGVGGSGTRVVAEILKLFGYYMGDDLNNAHDNLVYTLLFKRPRWFYKNHQDEKKIFTGLGLMSKLMAGDRSITPGEFAFLTRAVVSMSVYGHNHLKYGTGIWPFERVKKMILVKRKPQDTFTGWGWKEPNSHLLIHYMADYFEDFKYIHTIRHGLDMAFSANQQQLFNWGRMFNVQIPKRQKDIPEASFQYWIRSNSRVIQSGESLGNAKFLLVNFDELCRNPEPELKKIITFLEISPDEEIIRKAINLITTPKTMGRYKNFDISGFDEDDLSILESLGFCI